MRRKVFVATAVMAMAMVFTACKKKPDDNSSNNGGKEDEVNLLVVEAKNVIDGSSDITKVKAYVSNFDEYLVVSTNYTSNGFKMTLSKVPSKYLMPAISDFPFLMISDKSAKMTDVDFIAYDNADMPIGYFSFEDPITGSEATYVYADKNFTMKGIVAWDEEDDDDEYATKFDCTFKKGWNIMYETEEGVSTQKPAGASYVWKYWNWGGGGDDDYSMSNQKEKSRFPARLHRVRNRK